jgi:hypothetical protein
MAVTRVLGGAWLNVAVGIVIFLSPFLTGEMRQAPMWNALLVGALVVVLAGYNVWSARRNLARGVTGAATVNVLAGLWMIMYSLVAAVNFNYRWLNVAMGVILVVAAGYNAWAASREAPPRATPRRTM